MPTISEQIRRAWAGGRVEVIANVAMGLRLTYGCNHAQVHAMFCEALGREIKLAHFDEIMRLADDGYTGHVMHLNKRGGL
jgi:hypothetical protein